MKTRRTDVLRDQPPRSLPRDAEPSAESSLHRLLVALTVPASLAAAHWGLHVAGDPFDEKFAAPVGPFATDELALVQVLAAWPLAWWAAERLEACATTSDEPQRKRLHSVFRAAGAVGAALTLWLTIDLGAGIAFELDAAGAGFVVRAAVRSLWSLALVVPWAMFLAPRTKPQRSVSWPGFVVALAVGFLAPAVFAWDAGDKLVARTNDALRRFPSVAALGSLEAVCDLGMGSDNQSPHVWQQLRQERRERRLTAEQAVQVLGRPTDDAGRATLGVRLAEVERWDDAATMLASVTEPTIEVRLALGAIAQRAGRLDESDAAFRAVISTIVSTDASPASVSGDELGWLVQAYDGLAFNARERRNAGAVASIYLEAEAAAPAAAAHFQWELARSYRQLEHPQAAAEAARRAAILSRDYAERAEAFLASLNEDVLPCRATH